MALEDALHQRVDCRLVSQVHVLRVTAGLCCDGGERFGVAVHQNSGRALFHEAPRSGTSDPARGARDDDDLSSELLAHCHVPTPSDLTG